MILTTLNCAPIPLVHDFVFPATVSGSGKVWRLTSRGWDDELEAGQTLDLTMIVHYSGAKPAIISVTLNDESLCSEQTEPPRTSTTADPNPGDCGDDYTVDSEDDGFWQGSIKLTASQDVHGWTVVVQFDNTVDFIDSALGNEQYSTCICR